MTPEKIIEELIAREGGYVDHPNDKGGPTNFGITLKVLSEWRGRPVTAEDVKGMAQSEAAAIYRAKYLKPFAHLTDGMLKIHLTDIAVNSGVKQAVTLLQKALGLPLVDGQFGPVTATALAGCRDWRLLNNLLVGERMKFLSKLVKRKPSQLDFLVGWTNRACTFLF